MHQSDIGIFSPIKYICVQVNQIPKFKMHEYINLMLTYRRLHCLNTLKQQ